MKKIIVILMMMLPMVVNAQRVDKPGEPYDYFVTVKGIQNMSKKIKYFIEWPDDKIARTPYDSDGNKVEFYSYTNMFLYMSKRGWSFVSQFTYDGVLNFVFKKAVTSDKQAKEYFYFEDDFKNKGE